MTARRAPAYWPEPPRRGVRTMEDRAFQYANLGKFVTGLAIPYHVATRLPDGTLERIEPGAFGAFADVYATLNHDVAQILGATHDDTLVLWEEHDGVHVLLDPASAHASRHQLLGLLRLGVVTGMSFRMGDVHAVYNTDTREGLVQTVLQATLRDVSVLTGRNYPTYRSTWVRVTRDRLAD